MLPVANVKAMEASWVLREPDSRSTWSAVVLAGLFLFA